MTETVIVGILSGLFGVVAVGIPAFLAYRKAPSRVVADTASIVDSSGQVIGSLRSEIDRLDKQLDEAREELGQRPTRKQLLDDNDLLTSIAERLRQQLRDEGITPKNGPIRP